MSRRGTDRMFSVPKALAQADECEDAFSAVRKRARVRSFALADGASRTMGSGLWARILVSAHSGLLRMCAGSWPEEGGSSRELFHPHIQSWLQPLRQRWLHGERRALGPRVQHWAIHNKLLEGAYAAFLAVGLEQRKAGGCRWRALAIGDTCLFIVKDGALDISFPIDAAAAFNASPFMFGTRSLGAQAWHESIQFREGEAAPGCWLFAMTDALGKWCLERVAQGENPWEVLLGFRTREAADFADWVLERRASNELETDDTTLFFTQV